MSETTDDEFLGRQALKKSRTGALRERMKAFADEQGRPTDLKALRQRAATGEPLSTLVEHERDERV